MKYTVHIGERPIVLEHDNFDDTINVDELTAIDSGNIYGDAVTISAATNRVGLLKSEVEARLSGLKLEIKIFEAKFKADLRRQAAQNSGKYKIRVGEDDIEVKLSETGLKTCFEDDEEWIALQKSYINTEKQFNQLDSLYWAAQDKSKKLNNLVNGTTPKEFVSELIEGKFNGILLTKK